MGQLLSITEAKTLILAEAKNFGTEIISIEQSLGRIIAENIYADRNYPPFNRSAVDGFAIMLEDLGTFSEFKIIEEVHAGSYSKVKIYPGAAIKIMTGAPVPKEATAVIKVEDSNIINDIVTFSLKDLKAWTNIAQEGEDLLQNDIAIPLNTEVTPLVLAILASVGKSEIKVFSTPKISIISTGNEIKKNNEAVEFYQIRDSNSYALESFFKYYQIPIWKREIVLDEKDKLHKAIQNAIESDIIILSGGVSMGDADFVPEVLQGLGIKKIFHKIAIKPGKPLWFGKKENGPTVFALPGNPFSCEVAFKIFIEPYLRTCFGLKALEEIALPFTGRRKKKSTFDEFFPCELKSNTLVPVSANGSGDLFSVIASNGIAHHPAETQELINGTSVSFIPWKGI